MTIGQKLYKAKSDKSQWSVWIRTPVLYVDDSQLRVTWQWFDDNGNTIIDSSGLTVSMVVQCKGCDAGVVNFLWSNRFSSFLILGTAPLTGINCAFDSTHKDWVANIPETWFSSSSDRTAKGPSCTSIVWQQCMF